MNTPDALPYTHAALLVVAAHAAGVTHGAALEARHSAASPAPDMPEQAVEVVTEAAAETPDPHVIARIWWGQGGIFITTEDSPPQATAAGFVLLGQLWLVPQPDGSIRYFPGWEDAAGSLTWSPTAPVVSTTDRGDPALSGSYRFERQPGHAMGGTGWAQLADDAFKLPPGDYVLTAEVYEVEP